MINVKVYNRWAQFLTPYTRKVGMAVRYVLPQPVQANERQTQEKEKEKKLLRSVMLYIQMVESSSSSQTFRNRTF